MITLQNKDLEPIALTLQAFGMVNKQLVPVSGLLHEDISLGLKRRLQKIRTDVIKQLGALQEDEKQIREKFPVKVAAKDKALTKAELKTNAENLAKQEAEFKILYEEEVKIDQEMASLEMILNIKTKANYDFDLIEKFAE